MAGGNGFEGGLAPGVGLKAVQLRRLDVRSDPAPGDSAFVVTREECIFPCKGNRPGEILDTVAVHLDAAVGEDPVPSFLRRERFPDVTSGIAATKGHPLLDRNPTPGDLTT